jgi:ABC-2 type transport system ATP-binding protein
MQNNIVVKARGVKKKYSDNNALNGFDLDLRQGQILGLIGPNGAGKSTFLHAVLGLLKTEGSLEVLGLDPFKDRHELLKRVCSITDVAVLPKWMTVDQVLDYVEGVHPEFDPKKARHILSKTNIRKKSKVRTLSRGMIVQLHLSIVMAIDAELLVLDEPTLGLDLVYRKEFYSQLIEDYFDGNKTILISTHQVEEIEGVLTDVVFLDKGQAIMTESIDSLNQKFLELRPHGDNEEKAKSLNPINIRSELGRKVFLYENTDTDKLSSLGDVRAPYIADLFVAIMNPSSQSGDQS